MIGNMDDEMALPIAVPKPAPGKHLSSAVVTTLLSVMSLLVGILVTDLLAKRRERAQSTLEARRIDAERDTPAYREFTADWQGSIDPAHLKSSFTQLAAKAGMPEHVRHLYMETVNLLNDPSATPESKRAATDRLIAAIDALTRTPHLG